jgi:histidine triad (HIT) family protein
MLASQTSCAPTLTARAPSRPGGHGDAIIGGVTESGDAPPGGRDCAFCAIIRGELPAARILETEHLLAFLDHRPLFRGHTLLVPKRHMRLLSDLPAGLATEFLTTAQRLELAIEDGLGVSGSMVLVNNVVSQSVPHLHLHVIPREFKDGLRFWLGPRHPYNDENPAQAYADKIRGALRLLGIVRFPGLAGSACLAGTGLGRTFRGHQAFAGQSSAKATSALGSPSLHPGPALPHPSPEPLKDQDIWAYNTQK